MPRDNKKRGRRAEAQKRKADELVDDVEDTEDVKRPRLSEQPDVVSLDEASRQDYLPHPEQNGQPQDNSEMPFYGLLDEQEQEYFRRADDMLEANNFADPEESTLFLENVYKEADGKELKMACSQSSSRLLERLILLSTPAQLKKLFQKFNGHFLNLVQHRFASHCCETLFKQSAPVVTQELLDPSIIDSAVDATDPVVSMENLFLFAITELQGNLGFLMTDRFGAHVLRVLLTVLSGQPFEETGTQKSLLASKRKETVEVANVDKEKDVNTRAVPEAFTSNLEKMMNDSVAGLETSYLRTLATHPIGNPSLQLLIRLELTHFGKQRAKEETSILKKLLPDDPLVEGTESAAFINNLVYDAVGSRLLETILEYAPGKLFKQLYKEFFRERMGSLARNEVAGYVVAKIVERLSSDDLSKAVELILPQVPNLAERGRTSLVRIIIERCAARGVDTAKLAETIHNCWADDDKPDDLSLAKMLLISPSEAAAVAAVTGVVPPVLELPSIIPADQPTKIIPTTPASIHTSLLAQTMLRTPGVTATLINTAISNLSDPLCLRLAFTPTLSPILQTSLTAPSAPLIFRRKLIKRFYSHICALALDPAGSHLVDAIWAGTQGMAFARERIAEELAESESVLRDSRWGRKVWRNWKMDLYRRKRREWVRSVRGEVGNDGFLSFPGGPGSGDEKPNPEQVQKGLRTKRKQGKELVGSEVDAIKRNGGESAETIEKTATAVRDSAPIIKAPTPPNRGYNRVRGGQKHNQQDDGSGKSKLDQARQRFVMNKEKREREMANQSSGSA